MSNSIKIKFHHNYMQNDARVNYLFRDFLPMHFINNKWKNIEISENEYDFLVCFNSAPNDIDGKRIIVLDIEPPHSDYYSYRNDNFLYKTQQRREPIGWVIHLGLGYTSLINTVGFLKNKTLSTICSNNQYHFYNVLRRDFIHEYQKKHPIDIYGYGNNQLPFDKKYIGMVDYKYNIQAENHIAPFHCTEKIADSILSENLCFYFGAPNTSEIYHEKSFIPIDMTDFKESFKIINDHIRLNTWEDRRNIIIEEKKRILNDLQLAPKIHKIINDS